MNASALVLPGELSRDLRIRQTIGRLHVDDAHRPVAESQHEVRNVPTERFAVSALEQQRLPQDVDHVRVLVGDQKTRQPEAALVHHVVAVVADQYQPE